MKLSVKEVDITPSTPIGLSGFAHRDVSTETVYAPILLKIFYFVSGDRKLLFFFADLIWWDDQFVDEIAAGLHADFGIERKDICFHATHNHSGPQTTNKFSQKLGVLDKRYLEYLYDAIMKNTHELYLEKGETVTVEIYKGRSDIGIYRRKKHEGIVVMKPNNSIQIDDEVTFISFIGRDGVLRAGWIHFTCHPTSTDMNEISSEYVGVCCQKLSSHFGGAPIAFLQGFAGDIRPNLVAQDDFFRGTASHMEEVGERLANDVIHLMAQSPRRFSEFTLETSFDFLPLYFDTSIEGCSDSILYDEWKRSTKSTTGVRSLSIQKIMLNEHITFLCCNAEMVHSYGLYAKQYGSIVLPVGYSNGMIGYIANNCQLVNGGYEAEQSIYYFNLNGKLRIGSQTLIEKKLKEIMGGHNENNS